MFFRNATIFAFPAGLDLPLHHLAAHQPAPLGALDVSSRGFVPVIEGELTRLTADAECAWFAVGGEDKIIPAAAINSALAKKLAEVEKSEGRRPGTRMRKRYREDIIHEMLPRALTRPVRTDAYLDLRRGLLFVDTASRKAAEAVVSEVRNALGSFPALPLNAEVAPRAVMTGWLGGEPLPDGLALGEEAILTDAMDGGAVARFTNQDLTCEEVTRHLEAGKQAARLALFHDCNVSFTVGEDLALRKVKFLEGAVERLETCRSEDADTLRAELDARFALMTGELGRLYDVLASAFRLTSA